MLFGAADSTIAFATYNYRIVTDNGPSRITVSAANPDDPDAAKNFGQAFGMKVEEFALFEYDNQVMAGTAQSAGAANTAFAGYNTLAVNDILTQWTPALPPVRP